MADLKSPMGDHAILATGEHQQIALKKQMENRVAEFASGGSGSDVLSVIRFLDSVIPMLQRVVDTPGVAQLAKNKYDNQAYDVIGDMTVLISKINLTINEVWDLIPTHNGFLLLRKRGAGNNAVFRLLTSEQLAPVTAKMNEIIAMIE